jgi:hypothetical protein
MQIISSKILSKLYNKLSWTPNPTQSILIKYKPKSHHNNCNCNYLLPKAKHPTVLLTWHQHNKEKVKN